MALLGKSLALTSVGLSCQTAHQLRAHKALVSEMAGESMEECGTPFDWVICPVKAATRMIATGTFFPSDRQALDGTKRPYWPEMDVHFWHWHFDDWLASMTKATHVRENWQRIAESERKVFILSNTQNNIASSLTSPPSRSGRPSYPPIQTSIDGHQLHALHDALKLFFGEIELHVVTHSRSLEQSFWRATPGPIKVHAVGRDPSVWEGDVQAWQKLLPKIVHRTY